MQTVLTGQRERQAAAARGRRGLFTKPQGPATYLILRPLSDLFLWAWRLERRTEFLYRPWFDRWLRPPLFWAAQALQNALRKDEHLRLAEERLLPGEEELTREIIGELSKFTRENWLPGAAQRFGNTKTFGVLRGEFSVLPDLPERLRRGLFAEAATYPAWVRFSGPGPYAPPDVEDYGQCSVGIKVMGVPGPKLMGDERFTQDLILVSPASFVTPDIVENAKLQRWVRAKAPLAYAINPGDSHLLHLFMQLLYSPMHANPLEVQYYSNVPFLLGEGQAVQYSLKPVPPARTKIPPRPAENYLRDAMVRTLAAGQWSFDFMVQVQTDPHRMPVENASVKWPERMSPYIPVARLRLPAQRFDSDQQLAFADVLRFNPWHSLADHRPLGNSNRARREMYSELAKLRQAMNQVEHVEPTGAEQFPGRFNHGIEWGQLWMPREQHLPKHQTSRASSRPCWNRHHRISGETAGPQTGPRPARHRVRRQTVRYHQSARRRRTRRSPRRGWTRVTGRSAAPVAVSDPPPTPWAVCRRSRRAACSAG